MGILMHTQPGKNATRNVPQQKRYRVLRVDALGRPFVSPTAPASLTQARGGFAPVAQQVERGPSQDVRNLAAVVAGSSPARGA